MCALGFNLIANPRNTQCYSGRRFVHDCEVHWCRISGLVVLLKDARMEMVSPQRDHEYLSYCYILIALSDQTFLFMFLFSDSWSRARYNWQRVVNHVYGRSSILTDFCMNRKSGCISAVNLLLLSVVLETIWDTRYCMNALRSLVFFSTACASRHDVLPLSWLFVDVTFGLYKLFPSCTSYFRLGLASDLVRGCWVWFSKGRAWFSKGRAWFCAFSLLWEVYNLTYVWWLPLVLCTVV